MNKFKSQILTICLLLVSLTLTACDGDSQQGDNHAEGTGGRSAGQAPKNPNLIDIPSAVRSNLGISFIEVERRRVEKTLRVPGRFEYLPDARREYRTPVPGRVELVVDQFETVDLGALLYRIDSPGWRDLQQQLTEAGSEIDRLSSQIETYGPLLKAHEAHEESLQATIDVWIARVEDRIVLSGVPLVALVPIPVILA